MAIRNLIPGMALAALLVAPLTSAGAQTPAPIQPRDPAISAEQARRIAADNGVVRIEEIKLDGGRWEIEGRDSTGAEIEINLRASDGMVIKIERDRPVSAGATRP
jgi:uncharacterized membrane protein YkoI